MPLEAWNIGDTLRSTAKFRDDNNALADPDTVSIIVTDPDDNAITYVYGVDAEVTKSSTGVYVAKIPLTAAGRWRYKWVSTGDNAAAEPRYIDVETNAVVNRSTPPTLADPTYLYTSGTEIEQIYGRLAVDQRVNDNQAGTITQAEEEALNRIIVEATETINEYVLQFYAPADLYRSHWVRRRASYLACHLLSIRQAESPQYQANYEQIIAELEAVADLKRRIPGIVCDAGHLPVLSNLVVDSRYDSTKLRVNHDSSTSPSYPGQHIHSDNLGPLP